MAGRFDGIVRDRNPDTSWEAAAKQTFSKREALRAAIRVLLATRGDLSDEQIADAYVEYQRNRTWLPLTTPQSLRTQRKWLVVQGVVRDAGERRRTRSGSTATVWALTPFGAVK